MSGRGGRLLAAVVAAQVGTQIGAFALPALLPAYMARWSLGSADAGWLVGIFYAGYVVSVPVLLALTDRVAARRVYLLGAGLTAAAHLGFALLADGFWSGLACRALAGVGWAGAYMPGLKILADRFEGDRQARAVSWHAAGVGAASALSFGVAGGIAAFAGPDAAFLFAGFAALFALLVAACGFPGSQPSGPAAPRRLFDFRPVFRNRRAMGWIAGYAVHTWEMAAVRAWGVTFLAATFADGAGPGPTFVFTVAGIVGILCSLAGNEAAIRLGRRGLVTVAMTGGAVVALVIGWVAPDRPWLAAGLVILWLGLAYLDSSALTAGTVQAADRELRGATMGLHSMAGYAGGLVGPIGVGLALDLTSAHPDIAWWVGFAHLAPVGLLGLLLVRRLGGPEPGRRSQ